MCVCVCVCVGGDIVLYFVPASVQLYTCICVIHYMWGVCVYI